MKLLSSFKFDWNFNQMIQSKTIVFAFYLLCLFPFLVLTLVIKEKNARYEDLEDQVGRMRLRIERSLDVQKDRNAFYKKYEEVDRYYLDHVLEAVTFLKPEVEALKLVSNHPAFESSINVKNRLDKLTKGDNRLLFLEENRKVQNHIEELDLKQKSPVEINSDDLKYLLTLVEGVTIGENKPPKFSPQFIVRRMALKKKKLAERETFLIEMHLIKREVVK